MLRRNLGVREGKHHTGVVLREGVGKLEKRDKQQREARLEAMQLLFSHLPGSAAASSDAPRLQEARTVPAGQAAWGITTACANQHRSGASLGQNS